MSVSRPYVRQPTPSPPGIRPGARDIGPGHRAGFSLIEVMVAMLVLTVLTLGGAAALFHSSRIIAHQNHRRVALEVANQHIEQLRTTAFHMVPTGTRETTAMVNGWTRKVITVVTETGSPSRPLKEVVVQVQYQAEDDPVGLSTRLAP